MESWFGPVLIIFQLIYLEGILSIDNAAVLGAMVAGLPANEPIPWPRMLRFLARPVHRILGGQRLAALKVGLLGAYLGRGAMLFAAAWVVRNHWLLLLGGAYLIFLAVSHFGGRAEERRGPEISVGMAFWVVVLYVEMADLAFSLDNVVAAVALSREMWVILTGVALGIVTMRFAAGVFVTLIQRFPELEAAAYLLVFVIGIQLLAEEFFGIHLGHVVRFAISASIIVLAVLYGKVPALQAMGARMRWAQIPFAWLSALGRLIAWPVRWGLTQVVRVIRPAIRGAAGLRRPATSTPAPSDPAAAGRAADAPSPGSDGGG